MPDLPEPEPEALLSVRDFARIMGVATETVRRWVRAKRLVPAGTTPGGHYRFRRSQVAECMRSWSGRSETTPTAGWRSAPPTRSATNAEPLTPRAQAIADHVAACRQRLRLLNRTI